MDDPYAALGIPDTATQNEVKTAYRKLALKYHPDKSDKSTNSEQLFHKIQAAYELIGNETERRKFDAERELSKLASQRQAHVPTQTYDMRTQYYPTYTTAPKYQTQERRPSTTFYTTYPQDADFFNRKEPSKKPKSPAEEKKKEREKEKEKPAKVRADTKKQRDKERGYDRKSKAASVVDADSEEDRKFGKEPPEADRYARKQQFSRVETVKDYITASRVKDEPRRRRSASRERRPPLFTSSTSSPASIKIPYDEHPPPLRRSGTQMDYPPSPIDDSRRFRTSPDGLYREVRPRSPAREQKRVPPIARSASFVPTESRRSSRDEPTRRASEDRRPSLQRSESRRGSRQQPELSRGTTMPLPLRTGSGFERERFFGEVPQSNSPTDLEDQSGWSRLQEDVRYARHDSGYASRHSSYRKGEEPRVRIVDTRYRGAAAVYT